MFWKFHLIQFQGLLKPGCLSEPKPPLPPECAGLKAEQDKINKGTAKQEFINMLLTKTNVFRNELFNFKVKSKEIQAKVSTLCRRLLLKPACRQSQYLLIP